MDPTDKKLIQRALQGDQRAYAELLSRHREGVFHVIYRMVGNRDEAEDLVQETFIKAFRALSSFDDRYAFSTWLYKIAVNHCIDALRRRKLSTESLDATIPTSNGELTREIPHPSQSPEGSLISKEQTQLILEAIESLPPIYREIIKLRHQKEKSYEEIGKILGIPLGTVKARIFRARELLKKKLKGLA